MAKDQRVMGAILGYTLQIISLLLETLYLTEKMVPYPHTNLTHPGTYVVYF